VTTTSNVEAVAPAGQPLLVRDVHIGGAITEGPAVMAVLTDQAGAVVVLQWQTADDAERNLSAMLAHVHSLMPLPPVVDLRPRTAVTS
jgi:hypothetical protein